MASIVTKVLGIIIRPDLALFVEEGFDSVEKEHFYRPLGGRIEFGERSEAALAREFREELGAELVDLRPFGVLENIFVYEGEESHEILFLYSCGFRDDAFLESKAYKVNETGGKVHTASWMAFEDWSTGQRHIVPDGLVDMLKSSIQLYEKPDL